MNKLNRLLDEIKADIVIKPLRKIGFEVTNLAYDKRLERVRSRMDLGEFDSYQDVEPGTDFKISIDYSAEEANITPLDFARMIGTRLRDMPSREPVEVDPRFVVSLARMKRKSNSTRQYHN